MFLMGLFSCNQGWDKGTIMLFKFIIQFASRFRDQVCKFEFRQKIVLDVLQGAVAHECDIKDDILQESHHIIQTHG